MDKIELNPPCQMDQVDANGSLLAAGAAMSPFCHVERAAVVTPDGRVEHYICGVREVSPDVANALGSRAVSYGGCYFKGNCFRRSSSAPTPTDPGQ